MTDYNRSTGTAGTLRIRTTGGRIELWVLCSDPTTNVGSVTFATTINGVAQNVAVALPPGFGSRLIRSATQASGSQTVVLNMPATGTMGLGGPTNHSQALTLGAAPGAPGPLVVSGITETAATFTWGDASNNPTDFGLYVSTSPSFTSHIFQGWVGDVLTKTLATLTADTTYYARVRARNAIGTGPYGATVSFRTLGAAVGVHVSDGAAWHLCPVFVSDGAAWQPADVLVSDGAAWKEAIA